MLAFSKQRKLKKNAVIKNELLEKKTIDGVVSIIITDISRAL